ncbi:MAG TPA: hypothetical protein VH724_00315, partial [Candidatus Angelobacter sp.]|nr:hypothetical protein [Candidatus Angelobacter sp.]
MKLHFHTFAVLVMSGFISLFLSVPRALAQNSPDDQPHIQPRTTPTPTPTPRASQPAQKPQDVYERPPFPGDTSPTRPNDPSPKSSDRY